MKNGISRRSFIAGTGAAVSGFAAGSLIGYSKPAAADPGDWAVLGLDNKTNVMDNAFYGYFGGPVTAGGCCFGAARGLIQTIRDAYGATANDWDPVPLDIFRWGAGGGFATWGTLCGALNGALWVMQQAIGKKPAFGKAVDTLLDWYVGASFPDVLDADLAAILNAKTNYPVKDPVTGKTVYYDLSVAAITGGATGNIATTVSNSPLCHASVSTFLGGQKFGAPAKPQLWVPLVGSGATISDAATRAAIIASNASVDKSKGPRVGGIEKKVRCACLTAQVAWKAAQIITDVNAGTAITGWVYAGDPAENCIQCHTKRPDYTSALDNEQGKMPCEACHDDRTDDSALYQSGAKNTAPKCVRP